MIAKRGLVVGLFLIVLGIFFFTIVYLSEYTTFGEITGFATYTSDPGAGQTTLTLQEANTDNGGDAFISEGFNTRNWGIDSTIEVEENPDKRAYIKFNITGIPANQTIEDSQLCLYLFNDQGSQTIYANHVYTQDWNEGSEQNLPVDGQNYTTNISWVNQPCGVSMNDSSRCNLTSESSTTDDGTLDGIWQCWNVTNAVSSDYASGNTNLSIVLFTTDLGNPNSYYSKEYTLNTTLNPYLNITYSASNLAPSITITNPQNGSSLGYNESISLNYVTSDTEGNLDSCWYNINNGINTSLSSCANTTFSVPGDGTYTINIYANDTLGLQGSDSSTITVAIGAPSISLSEPVNQYLPSNDVTFRYTPTDIDLSACELWGNFSGNFELNQTNFSPTSGAENTFSLTLSDGFYEWNIKCNDTVGNSAFNGNQTFHVDTTIPGVSISEPTGTKTSRTDIPLTYSITDLTPLTCWYNVYRGESLEKSNTTLDNCTSSSFSVSVDADFTLNLYTNDSAGNENTANTTFTVDTSTSEIPGGGGPAGGGGGGSGSSGTTNVTGVNLEIKSIETIMSPGEEKALEVSIKNNGKLSVNKCKLKTTEEYKSWISSTDVKNIAAGEIIELSFTLTMKEENKNPSLSVECLEGEKSVSLKIISIKPSISVEFIEIVLKEKNQIHIKYSAEADTKTDSTLIFAVYSEKEKIKEQTQEINLEKNKKIEQEIIIQLEDTPSGILKISITNQGEEKPLIEDSIIYDSGLITGYASMGLGDGKISYPIIIILVIFTALAALIIRRIIKNKKE